MCLINNIFPNYLDKFVIFILNDIILYYKLEEEHEDHLIMVLHLLKLDQLHDKMSKCSFYERKVHYLGHIISEEGIVLDP